MNDKPVQTEVDQVDLQTQNVGELQPKDLIEKAISGQDPNVEVLERLLSLQERYEKREAKKAFEKAMSDMRGDLPNIIKNNKVSHKGASYSYEDLPQITQKIKPVLEDHGFNYRWNTETKNDRVRVECIVSHELGHSETTSLEAGLDMSGSKNSIQGLGSTVTYLQRYTLKSALGLSAAPDDDANSVDQGRSKNESNQNRSASAKQIKNVREQLNERDLTLTIDDSNLTYQHADAILSRAFGDGDESEIKNLSFVEKDRSSKKNKSKQKQKKSQDNEGKFSCNACDYTSDEKSDMKVHYQTEHQEDNSSVQSNADEYDDLPDGMDKATSEVLAKKLQQKYEEADGDFLTYIMVQCSDDGEPSYPHLCNKLRKLIGESDYFMKVLSELDG